MIQTYQYDPAGNLKQITQGTASTAFTNDDASHLAALTTASPAKGVSFTYDGRDYLTLADTAALPFLDSFETGDVCAWSAALGLPVLPTCPTLPAVHPTYSSEGLLHALQRATAPQRSYVFHFAGRPVAQMDLTGTTESWKLLTVDHLGTPIVATGTSGTVLWKGGFEPFGADWNGAGGAGVFLRFPGQWVDGVWGQAVGTTLYYNLNRWYDLQTGRYISTDPVYLGKDVKALYSYVLDRPVKLIDPRGLFHIDPSCNNLECIPQSFGHPNLLTELRLETQWQCETLDYIITDIALLNCLKHKCNDGKIYCKDADGDPKNNCNYGKAGAYGPVGGEANLCPGNWTYGVPPWYLGETIIHEWAHNCGWKHGEGKGVPNNFGE